MTIPEPAANDFSPCWSRPEPAASFRRRLFCFPFAGGGAAIFRPWRSALPRDVEVIGVQLPGREGRFREPLFKAMAPLVEQLAEAIQPLFDRPVTFFGHSAGALMAFELARTMEANWGLRLERLIIGGCNPPHLQSPLNYSLHHLPDAELVDAMRKLNGTPQVIFDDPELMQLFLPVVRADIGLAETYACPAGAKLGCPITALWGERDGHTSREAVQRWSELTGKEFSMRVVNGDHFFPATNREETVAVIGEVMG